MHRIAKTLRLLLQFGLIACVMLVAIVARGESQYGVHAPDPTTNSAFGISIAASSDIAIVGAVGSLKDLRQAYPGKAYVIDLTSGETLHELTGTSRSFGSSVAVDGNFAVVGSHKDTATGAAYVFDAATGEQLHRLTPSGGESLPRAMEL
jgi:outer membrane protein assembly factor BamB